MLPASAFRYTVSQSGTEEFWYQTGSPYSSTRLFTASAFSFIPVPDCPDARQFGILTSKKTLGKGVMGYIHPSHPHCKQSIGTHPARSHPARPYCWRWKGMHPACQYCWRWKGIHPAHPLLAVERDTPCTSILLAVEGDISCTSMSGCGNGYILHVLLAVEKDKPCTSIDSKWWCYSCFLFMMLKIYMRNTGMWGKSQYGIKISSGSQLPQSSISIPASGSVRYRWLWISLALPSFDI